MHFSLFRIIPLHVSNRVTIYHQEAFTVYAVYGIYHASTLTIANKITVIMLAASQCR